MPTSAPRQGDVRLLNEPVAVDLLARPLPVRMAYTAPDGTPRIVPTWFHWTGDEIVMATWVSGPHVQHPARRIRDLRDRPDVALSIDTDDQPPLVLQIRGRATVTEVDGIAPEYALAARRYFGEEAGAQYVSQFDPAKVRMARIGVTPSWVSLIDFQTRLPSPLGGVAE
jgi:Pyridoxamine 5'-phosphate oxidase